jgi:hypothetical protein
MSNRGPSHWSIDEYHKWGAHVEDHCDYLYSIDYRTAPFCLFGASGTSMVVLCAGDRVSA